MGKKRKAPSYSTPQSSQGETKVKLINADEHTLRRKVRKVGWSKMELIDTPASNEFDFDDINSLWFH